MHGIITLCGHSGQFIALFTSVLVASDGTGSALAELLIQSLHHGEPFNLSTKEVRQQLTCFPGDGQYQSMREGHGGLRVAEHLCEKLKLNYTCGSGRQHVCPYTKVEIVCAHGTEVGRQI